jgi:hypothetical protein
MRFLNIYLITELLILYVRFDFDSRFCHSFKFIVGENTHINYSFIFSILNIKIHIDTIHYMQCLFQGGYWRGG